MHDSRPPITIIGGGIVGLASGLSIQRKLGRPVRILEAEDGLARHQTGNNSGVIHAGLYYKPGSLKATNCASGREAMYRFCAEHDIAHERCGKLVVATNEDEVAALDELERRGAANGLDGIERVGPEAIREREPAISGVAGLLVPQTGIVDYKQVAEKYGELIVEGGGEILTNTRVTGIRSENGAVHLDTSAGEFETAHLVNCAGLQSDRVARLCGADPGVRIVPFRGEYYELVPERAHLVKHLVYPVPDARFPFLGVHFTRMVHGGVEAGPNAVLAFKREGYSHREISLVDSFETFTFPGFWKLAFKFWKTGSGEFYRSLSKRAFVQALRKLMPDLQLDDVVRGGAGVRAQALTADGKLVDDFRIVESERAVHVLNAPSPAATASLSVGETIALKVKDAFGL